MKENILIIDSSVAVTGAFKCALNEVKLLEDDLTPTFIIPSGSTLDEILTNEKIAWKKLPTVEIGKAFSKLILYIPMLIINGIKLRKFVRQHQIDIVHVNDFYNLLGALLKFSGSKIKLITYVRFLPQSLPGPLRKLWTACAIRYSHKVVCVSDIVKDQMPKHPKVIRIYDPVLFQEKHSNISAPQGDKIIFTYLGNYIQGKGQNFALDAFIQALKTNPEMLLQFAGGDMGLEKNRQFRQQLENMVASAGLQSSVTFLPFITDTEKLIKESDVLLNFSESESFSMTCLEASYHGRPVIATRCGGPEEIIVHEDTGLLVKNRDVKEMETAILQMAAFSPIRLQEMGLQASQYVRNKFSTGEFVTSFKKAIQ